MQDVNALEGKSLAELREIGKALGIENVMLKKKELLERIGTAMLGDGPRGDAESAEEPKRRGRRPRMSGVRVEGRTPAETHEVPVANEPAEAVAPEVPVPAEAAVAAPKRRGRKPKNAEEPVAAPAVAETPSVVQQPWPRRRCVCAKSAPR